MIGNQVRSSLLASSSMIAFPRATSLNELPYKPRTRHLLVRASSTDGQSSYDEGKNHLGVVLDVPRNIWRQSLRPLSDFGFGKRSVWEGGVGLFIVSGATLVTLSLAWLGGFQRLSKFRKYQTVFELTQASGICTGTGTPVRIREVTVGLVIRVNPYLKNIGAVAERPLHPECGKEGLIVCDRQKIKGDQGVSLDAFVGIFTSIGREVEDIGVANTYWLAERAASVIDDAKPLLRKIQAMAEDAQPLLSEFRESSLCSRKLSVLLVALQPLPKLLTI